MILSLAILGYAQTADTGTVTGRVMNGATGQYLTNAIVNVAGTAQYVTTAFGGSFTLTGVPAGEVKLRVSYTGLDSVESTVKVMAGQSVVLDFSLTSKDYNKEIVQLGKFEVTTVREGSAKAIMEQIAAINPVKVLAADSMGNVTEGNIGEFLVDARRHDELCRGRPPPGARPRPRGAIFPGSSRRNARRDVRLLQHQHRPRI